VFDGFFYIYFYIHNGMDSIKQCRTWQNRLCVVKKYHNMHIMSNCNELWMVSVSVHVNFLNTAQSKVLNDIQVIVYNEQPW
jgi:hypothetical protein